ncbi:hypothetical protein Pelo_19699 [Pelomyxa schiedti]|nr:hypothetical protein Pelo_19699 [Pelomyxa schiedti]
MSSNEANHKWWVNYDGAASVSVASLATFNQPEIRLLPVYQGRPMAQMNLMFFNKLDPDELCMIWCNFDGSPSKTLMVASLANTSATGACQVLSPSTSYSFSELHNYHETGLVFTKKGGKRSFIILTWPLQPLQHILPFVMVTMDS